MSETARSENLLSARLARSPILVAPGVYDPLTALIAQRAGFEALYVSGAAIAYTRLGRPDIGLVSLSEVVETVALIRDRVGAPLIVDADTGYGNALNVERTVRLLERAGANAIQIEDQDFPKRCGHLDDKALIPAAGDGRQDQGRRRCARVRGNARSSPAPTPSPSRASTAPWRARRAIAKPAPTFCSSRRRAARRARPHRRARLKGPAPLMANMVEGGKTPILSASELEALGFALVIFPGAIVRALAKAARGFLRRAQDATARPIRSARACSISTRSTRLIGTPEMLARGKTYAGTEPQSGRTSGRR